MEIIIGKTMDVKFENRPALPLKDEGDFAVRVLHMRPARARQNRVWQSRDRRTSQVTADPLSAKVLVLLVPEGNRLPSDIDKGNYQVRLRIIAEKDRAKDPRPLGPNHEGFTRRV